MKRSVTVDEVLEAGRDVDENYWSSFTPASENQVREIEKLLEVELPQDFREFYIRVGWNTGALPGGGGVFSPDDLCKECSANIFFVTGSRTPGSEWASLDEHERFWKSNGNENPDPKRFTAAVLDFHGVPLWHLLSVGFDGTGSSISIYTGPDEPPFHFCKIHQSVLYYKSGSFLEGMLRHLREELDEEPVEDE